MGRAEGWEKMEWVGLGWVGGGGDYPFLCPLPRLPVCSARLFLRERAVEAERGRGWNGDGVTVRRRAPRRGHGRQVQCTV